MKNYTIQKSPFVVPTQDGKLIEEHFGLASDGNNQYKYCSYDCSIWLERTFSNARI